VTDLAVLFPLAGFCTRHMYRNLQADVYTSNYDWPQFTVPAFYPVPGSEAVWKPASRRAPWSRASMEPTTRCETGISV